MSAVAIKVLLGLLVMVLVFKIGIFFQWVFQFSIHSITVMTAKLCMMIVVLVL